MTDSIDVPSYNRRAWDREVEIGNPWTVPASREVIAAAREGTWEVALTHTRSVPKSWLGVLGGKRVLGLAAGGGQQCPIFAAAGAKVTLIDNSPAQLARDREVAEREGLEISLILGDMTALDQFADESFDLVFHPPSNCYVPDVAPVWREAYRVLAPGGALLSGFCNPMMFVFDESKLDAKELIVKYSIPFSELTSLADEDRNALLAAGEPLVFGHSLEDQIGGQTDAGFAIVGFYEDTFGDGAPHDDYFPSFCATHSVKMN